MTDLGRAPILLLALCACSQATSLEEAPLSALGPDFFTTEVLPILEERCFKCHGPEAKRVKGGLRITDYGLIVQAPLLQAYGHDSTCREALLVGLHAPPRWWAMRPF